MPQENTYELFNNLTGGWENVSQIDLPNAVASGQYSAKEDQVFRVVSPEGFTGSVKASGLLGALTGGFRLQTFEEQEERRLQQKYGDNWVEAAAEGAARGLTFGLSDHAFKKLGISEERLREIKERNKAVSLTSEIGAILAPLMISGGTAAPVAGAKALATTTRMSNLAKVASAVKTAGIAPRLVAGAGRSVEKSLAKALVQKGAQKAAAKSLSQAVVQRAIPRAAGSAVEGAFYGGGHLLSENALGNADLNAETLASSVGIASLFAGGLGATVTLPGIISRHYADVTYRKAVGAYEKARQKASSMPVDKAESYLKSYRERLTQAATKANADAAKRGAEGFFGTGDATPYTAQQRMASVLGGIDDPQYTKWYQSRTQQVDDALPEGEIASVFSEWMNRAQNEVLPAIDDEVWGLLGKSKVRLKTQPLLDHVNKQLKEANRLQKIGGGQDNVIDALEGIKELLVTRAGKGKAVKFKAFSMTALREHLLGIRRQAELGYRVLKRKGIPQEVRVDKKALMNYAAFVNQQLKTIGPEELAPLMDRYSRVLRSTGEISSLLGQTIQDPVTGKMTLSITDAGRKRLIKSFKELYVGDKEIQADNLLRSVKNFDDALGTDVESLIKDKIVHDAIYPSGAAAEKVSFSPWKIAKSAAISGIASITGHGLRGASERIKIAQAVMKGVRGKMFRDVLSNEPNATKKFIDKLGALEKVIKGQKDKVRTGVNGLFTKKGKRVSQPKRLFAPTATILFNTTYSPGEPKSRKTRLEAFRNTLEELSEIQANPEEIINTISHRVGDMNEVAPETAKELSNVAVRGVNYLHSIAPKDPLGDYKLFYDSKDWFPSDAELASFEQAVNVVENPLYVLDAMNNGSLTSDEIMALKAVYPSLYEDIARELTEQLADKQKDLPYKSKLQIEMFMGSPMDASSHHLQMWQDQFKVQEAPSPPRNVKFGRAESTMTEMQRLEGR
jgi:hypothetical protein